MTIELKELKETLLERKSIRTYGKTYPTEEQVQEIRGYIEKLNTIQEPFGKQCRFCLQTEDFYGIKTFGVITGCKYWIYGVVPKNDPEALKQYGYLFELLILKCTQMGLATVWLGGTFMASSFTAMEYDKANEYIPCVSPVGIDGKGMELMSKMAGGRKRREWETMFFNESFEHPLKKGEEVEPFNEYIFEGIRFSPSAVNAQEWRIVKEGKNLHFFSINKMFHEVDMGISVANAHVALTNSDINGKFMKVNEEEIREKVKAPKELVYIISFLSE